MYEMAIPVTTEHFGISLNSTENVSVNVSSATMFSLYSGILIMPMIVLSVIGNALTIYCFLRDEGLHKTCNVYILNLAVCDLLIGSVTMPIYLTYTLNDNTWQFGYDFCKVFLVFDFVTAGVTVILMILVSYDRLALLKHWSTYHKQQTQKRAYVKCTIAWMYLVILNGPATIGWNIWTGKRRNDSRECDAEFVDNEYFITSMAFIQFVIPLIILIIIHVQIVQEIRKLIIAREELTSIPSYGSRDSANSVLQMELRNDSVLARLKEQYDHNKLHRQPTKGTKAAKSLAVLTIAFFVTWAPYATALILRSFCRTCVNEVVLESFTWLLWFKSAINPFLYAFNSNRFKDNFKHYLCCKRRGYVPSSI